MSAERQVILGEDSFATVGEGHWVALAGTADLWLTGTFAGAVELDISFDGGATFLTEADTDGPRQFDRPQRFTIHEPELAVLYRLRCTVLTGGTIGWRFSAWTRRFAALVSQGVAPLRIASITAPAQGRTALDFTDPANSQNL